MQAVQVPTTQGQPESGSIWGRNPLLEGLDDRALELVNAAESLVPMLEARADEVDRSGHVAPDTFKRLSDAGFIRLFVPKRYGGEEQSLQAQLAISATLGRGCGSTAWMTQIVSGSSMMLSLFSEEAQKEAWGDNPSAGACASQSRASKVERVDGGYEITGSWSYLSGVEHAGWAMLHFIANRPAPVVLLALVPVADGRLEQTWNVVGMRGTASNTLHLQDYFVPDHRILSIEEALSGKPATPFRNDRLSKVTYGPAVEIGLLGSSLGVTQAALDYVLSKAPKRSIQYSIYNTQTESPGFQVQLAEAAVKFTTARLIAADSVREVDHAAAQGYQIDYTNRTRIRAAIGLASRLLRDAVHILTQAHGTSTFAEVNPLQRMWRDVNVATSHGMTTEMFGYELYGKALVGSDVRLAPLV